jgi:hypothetical protein
MLMRCRSLIGICLPSPDQIPLPDVGDNVGGGFTLVVNPSGYLHDDWKYLHDVWKTGILG